MAASPLPPSNSTPLFTSSSSSSSTHQLLTTPFTLFFHPSKRLTHSHFTPKSSSDPNPEPESDPSSSEEQDPFDSRINQIRLKYKSGTGKKAEIRKSKKGKQSSGSGSGMFLPPVELKEPISGGLKVDFGFSPYSERVNGRIAGLGLVALLLVELGSGKSVINYHTPSIVFLQVYFMAAVSAMLLKIDKEKVSVWPQD